MTLDDIASNLSTHAIALADMELRLKAIEANLSGTKTETVRELPNVFITISYARMIVRQFTRITKDSWDVHEWAGYWKFCNNVQEETAINAFSNSYVVAKIINRKDPA